MSAHSKNGAADEYETLPIGKLSPLQEDETSYYATAVIWKSQGRLKLARVTWFKEPVESWLARAEDQLPSKTIAPTARYTLPKISDAAGGCADNTWTATPGAPDGRQNHTAVWTGSEMIVWGGFPGYGPCLNTGGRYNPATDTWTATSALGAPTHALPTPRYGQAVKWLCGVEGILWTILVLTISIRWEIQSRYGHLGDYQCRGRSDWPVRARGSVDRERNDRRGGDNYSVSI